MPESLILRILFISLCVLPNINKYDYSNLINSSSNYLCPKQQRQLENKYMRRRRKGKEGEQKEEEEMLFNLPS